MIQKSGHNVVLLYPKSWISFSFKVGGVASWHLDSVIQVPCVEMPQSSQKTTFLLSCLFHCLSSHSDGYWAAVSHHREYKGQEKEFSYLVLRISFSCQRTKTNTLTHTHKRTHTHCMHDTHGLVSWCIFVLYLHRYNIFCPQANVQFRTVWGLFRPCCALSRKSVPPGEMRVINFMICISYLKNSQSWMWVHHAWNTIISLTDHNVSAPWGERERHQEH